MLSAQASLPLLHVLGSLSFFLGFFDVLHGEALESCTFMMAEMTAIFSPLIVLFYIEDYRRAILTAFKATAV
ncbi:hypothetical protein PENTCL1PPCAC_21484, partial [Pristionchus entomophagus]